MRFVAGERLYLTGEVEVLAKQKQEAHMEDDPMEGRITEFLERPIPADWDSYDLSMRLTYWCGALKDGGTVQLVQRKKICAMEIMKEMLCMSDAAIDVRRGKAINSILLRLGWERTSTARKFGPYGSQKGFYRPVDF